MATAGLAILLFVGAGVLAVLGMVDQRALWWTTVAWRYRDPEANEPSDAALAGSRFFLFVGAVLWVFLGGYLLHAQSGTDDGRSVAEPSPYPAISRYASPDPSKAKTYSSGEVRQRAEAVAAGLKGESRLDVEDIVTAQSDGNLRAKNHDSYKKDGYTVLEYELTNRAGEHPVCMTVRDAASVTNYMAGIESAEVREGRC